MTDFDTIIIGGGHNGLVCSAYLARSGQKVLLLEASHKLRGLAATREFSPRFSASVAHSLNHFSTKIASELNLAQHGYVAAAHALPTVCLDVEGKHVCARDGELTGVSESDNRSYQHYLAQLQRSAGALEPSWLKTMPRIGNNTLKEVLTFAQIGIKLRLLGKEDMREFLRVAALPARDLMDENFDSAVLKAMLSWDGLIGSSQAPRSPNNTVLTVLYRMLGDHDGAHSIPIGGIEALVNTLTEAAISYCSDKKNQVVVLDKENQLLQKQVDIRSELAERYAISQSDLLRIQSEHASLQSDLKSAVDSVSVAKRALGEERKRRDEVIADQEQEMEREAASAENELAKVDSALVQAKDKVDRLMVYSPVKGIVQDLSVTTINAVVGPGEVIMQIVPVDDEMIIESRLMPDEVGYVRPGQLADIRVDSYDSSRFDTIKGSVRQISPSTYLDENANPYYKVKVDLDKSWLGDREGQMSVIPGMTVQVDIITGSKTIMQYLLKPVTRGFSNAFTQR